MLRFMGAGTQRVKDAIKKMFPEAGVLCLDSDHAAGPGVEKIIGEFAGGGCNVLVGTHMIAKAGCLPDVELMGILGAEEILSLPDYRAPEKSFIALRQLERKLPTGSGKMLIQTMNPGHYAVRAFLSGRYTDFYKEEMRTRKAAGFPPYSDLIRVTASGQKDTAVKKLKRIAESLSRCPRTDVLGPAPVPGAVRAPAMQMLIRYNGGSVKKILADMAVRGRLGKVRINVDPQGIL